MASVAAEAVTGGAALAGGALDQAVFAPKQRRQAKQDMTFERGIAGRAQAAKINDALSMLMGENGQGGMLGRTNRGIAAEVDENQARLLDFDHSGLKATASRTLTNNMAATRAALGASGLGGSGLASLAGGRVISDTMTNLSGAIADDVFRRQQAASGVGMQGQQLISGNNLGAGLAALTASQNSAFGDAGFTQTKEFEQAMQGGK